MDRQLERLAAMLEPFRGARGGKVSVLTGAGISAESGIPTFRGPEGYWTVGSKEYRPEEMATRAMFSIDPWEVWAWYLYRRTVCARAAPNPGHLALARLEALLGDRMRLITQNVDGLHLRAGNTPERTFQIHGNLFSMRCARNCTRETFPIPPEIGDKGKNEPVTEREKALLVCPRCGGLARPHVLWFDEFYDEPFFRAESALHWAASSDLLLVVGTAGATTLPFRIGRIFAAKPEAVFIDVNPGPNPFREMAAAHPRGLVLEGKSGEILPRLVALWEGRPIKRS